MNSVIEHKIPVTEGVSRNRQALLLFGHGARDPAWAEPMQRVRQSLCRCCPDLRVELAFLEFMTPRLDEAIDGLVGCGSQHIVVVPMFLAHRGHLKRDVPHVLDSARQRHEGCRIDLLTAAGEADVVIDAMAAYALSGLQVMSDCAKTAGRLRPECDLLTSVSS